MKFAEFLRLSRGEHIEEKKDREEKKKICRRTYAEVVGGERRRIVKAEVKEAVTEAAA